MSTNTRHLPSEYSAAEPSADPLAALTNLATVRTRMDSLQHLLSNSINHNSLLSPSQLNHVSSELISAIHQIIINGATLLSFYQPSSSTTTTIDHDKPQRNDVDVNDVVDDDDVEIIEIDAIELLAEHIHFCEICGKGFKRDANLRMHMRAHGNQFKTPQALANPNKNDNDNNVDGRTRFSCPYQGCNRNKKHKDFKPLKSVICVKNHFKRSHCPKKYTCDTCHKKSFSVMADLKNHVKYCGKSDSRWKCSCGTTFSRKDKLFGHVSLFEGHMPAVGVAEDDWWLRGGGNGIGSECDELGNDLFWEGLLQDFESVDDEYLQDSMMASSSKSNFTRVEDFF